MKSTKTLNKLVCILLSLVIIFSLSACGEAKSITTQVYAMDTIMTLTAYGNNAQNGLNAAESTILALDTMLDPDVETSTTYAINHANGEDVPVTGPVADMLSTAITVYKQSDGAYDLTLYPLIERWGFTNQQYYVPTAEEISEDLARLCMDKITLTSFPAMGSYAVHLPSYGELSFASCAKGCASKYAIDAMRKQGVQSAIVSLGGNVQTLGVKPDGTDWTIGIVDPNNTSSYIATLSLGETAVVTSGPYQRYMPSNKTYHHLFSPKTGYPTGNGLSSVTIICEDGTLADCLSTAMYVSGGSAALKYWKTYGGFEMVIITDEYKVTATKGLIEKLDIVNPNYTLTFYE